MHELSLLQGVLRTVEREAQKNDLTRVTQITLEIGELSSVVPEYIARCFPVAFAGTILENARLHIERVPALCRCRNCAHEYPMGDTSGLCPACGGAGELIAGTDFVIKQIIAI